MNQENYKRRDYKAILKKLVESNEDACKVSERYRVMRFVLGLHWQNFLKAHDKTTWDNFLKDVVYIDRMIRKETHGKEKELKKILSQDFQLKELDVELHDNLTKDFIENI